MNKEKVEFTVQCDVCKQYLDNWVGSTPCCGSIAFRVNDDGSVSKEVLLFSNHGVATLNFGEKDGKYNTRTTYTGNCRPFRIKYRRYFGENKEI